MYQYTLGSSSFDPHDVGTERSVISFADLNVGWLPGPFAVFSSPGLSTLSFVYVLDYTPTARTYVCSVFRVRLDLPLIQIRGAEESVAVEEKGRQNIARGARSQDRSTSRSSSSAF